MKTSLYKSFFLALACVCGASLFVLADGAKAPEVGRSVEDSSVSVPANAYVTFSTVYNGKRYYLGVDTVAAKAATPKDTVAFYESPNHATMWIAGPLWSPTGDVLANKDYTRTIKSVWLAEREGVKRDRYLALGAGSGTYNTLRLLDASHATMWHTAKDSREQDRYINGFLYYYSDASGVETYRYLRYDPLYGFSRLFATQPTVSQRISVWTRTVGTQLTCQFAPSTQTFGFSTDPAGVAFNFTFRMRLEEGGDRFRSNFNSEVVYVTMPTVEENQQALHDKGVTVTLDWASSKYKDPSKKSYSLFTTKEWYYDEEADEMKERPKDSLMMRLNSLTPTPQYDTEHNNYTDVIYTVGTSPVDLSNAAGKYVDHRDYLHAHMTYKGVEYVDSALVIRKLYKSEPFTTLSMRCSPSDHTFPYNIETQQKTFDISAVYQMGTRYRTVNNVLETTEIGERDSLDLSELTSDGRFNILNASITLSDGTTTALVGQTGSTSESWIQNIEVLNNEQICVTAAAGDPTRESYRTAVLTYTFTYRHSSAVGDTVRGEQSIWVLQMPAGATEGVLKFSHQTGASGQPVTGPYGRQQVPNLCYDYYVIPGEANPLPVHHDHWGYYRWFIYKAGKKHGRDIAQNWDWMEEPLNGDDASFLPIGSAKENPYSRGRFDMRFNTTKATFVPSVRYNRDSLGGTAIEFNDTLACDISAYTDTLCKGSFNNNLTSLTEPTLSYRQLFAMHPAYERALEMEKCQRTNFADESNSNYMQKDTFLAPKNRPILLQPISPYKKQTADFVNDPGNLQYIYFYNPNPTDTIDENMGKKEGIADLTVAKAYNRVGVNKITGDTKYRARLIPYSEINSNGSWTKNKVIMVNPRKGTGYVLGKGNQFSYKQIPKDTTDTAQLRRWIENEILNKAGSSYDAFELKLVKNNKNDVSVKKGDDYICYSGATFIGIFGYGLRLGWASSAADEWNQTDDITMSCAQHSGTISEYITGAQSQAMRLQMHADVGFLFFSASNTGYLTACNSDGGAALSISSNSSTVLDAANQGWIFYEIIPPVGEYNHREIAKWQYKTPGGSWTDVTYGDVSSATSNRELVGGALRTSYGGPAAYTEYRLISRHFNLAHFTVYWRSAEEEGPSTTTIVSDDEIEQNYDIVADLGLHQLGKPGTSEMVSPYGHFAFDHTEFAYHYPVGSGEHQIPASKRVTGDNILPAKGEYCILNTFHKAGDDYVDVECSDGATQGYMYCFNRANRPLVFIDFTYPQPACAEQDFMLLANFCNPCKNSNPHVKADYYGHVPGTPAGQWKKIYTYLTGNLTEAGTWYQLALPLHRDIISKYDMFRCVGTVSATINNVDGYLLFDRFRLLAKQRAITSFQKHASCVTDNAIYVASRFDYTSAGLDEGTIVCFQYQKIHNGDTISLNASSGTGFYTRLDAEHTKVYPSYYKPGLDPTQSVTTAALKTTHGNDYGMFVVPETDYDPSLSATPAKQSAARAAVLDTIGAKILGLSGSDLTAFKNSHLDEHEDTIPAEKISLGNTFDFGDYDSPTMKVYANEGTKSKPHWVVYIINRLPIESATDTFRVAMLSITSPTSKPNFQTAGCFDEHIITAKGNVEMLVNGASDFEVQTREEAAAAGELLEPNASYTVSLRYNAPNGSNGTAMYDLFRSAEWDRDYDNMTPAEQATADARFVAEYGCTRYDFREAVRLFRGDNPRNPYRTATTWNGVTAEEMSWAGMTPTRRDSLYNLLSRLVENRIYEVGLTTRDIYLASKQDAYLYIFPVGGSGRYETNPGEYATGSICDHHIWLEMHAGQTTDSLRFGYDKSFAGTYMIPVIRASKTDANSELQVRVAAISHDDVLHKGVVIGWDSTHVVETNDPAWVPGTSSFRYTQDKILQDGLYSSYYHEGDVITFSPVNAEHISDLTTVPEGSCACLDYDPKGSVYNVASPRANGDTEGANVFVTPSPAATNCNKWHVKTSSGYQKPNNFELHAGYWYKFKTTFFEVSGENLIRANAAGDGTHANDAYFYVAVAPDTAVWKPAYTDGSNYWNDDQNWAPIVNGDTIRGALARVPMGDTRVIINAPELENQLPVVNNDSLGDVSKGDVDWGFKTATCDEVLFKPRSLIYGQELLNYRRAFVDVRFAEGQWRTFSPALDNIYSGDMYIPANVAKDADFAPLKFDDEANGPMSPTHNREWPYLFAQSYYNQSKYYAFLNTDKDGNPLDYKTRVSAGWEETNVLNQPMPAGRVNAMAAWGPEGNKADMYVRLPKQEKTYYYYTNTGRQVTPGVTLERDEFDDINKNLAYDKNKKGANAGITFTLTNSTAAKLFFFGNSSMALVDVYQLCLDNEDKLESYETPSEGKGFNVIELVDGATYTTHKVEAQHEYYLSPMRGIGLNAKAAATELNIVLKPTAMVAMPGSMTPIPSGGTAKRSMPARAKNTKADNETVKVAKLYVGASNTTEDGTKAKSYITLSSYATADDGFVEGQDVVSIISERNPNEYNFHTPMSMYTVCDNRPLMYDSRTQFTSVPLVFNLLSNDYDFAPYIMLSFATEGEWDKPFYLYDAFTGDSTLIRNGMVMAVATPQSDQFRYYINGAANTSSSDDHSGTPTGIEIVNEPNDQVPNDQMVHIYDVLGRHVMTLAPNDLISNVKLPTGVYIISRGNKTERMVIK